MTPCPLLLDMDGVLVHSASVHARAWERLFSTCNVSFPMTRYWTEANGRSRADVIRAVLGDRPDHDALMKQKAALVMDVLDSEGCPQVPGAAQFLKRARASGHPIAVATASRMPGPFLHAAGLSHLVDVVCDRTMVDRGKPAPDVYLLAAKRLGVDPNTAWAIEDSPPGIRAAQAAGCRVIGLTTNHPASALTADAVVNRLVEAWEILRD